MVSAVNPAPHTVGVHSSKTTLNTNWATVKSEIEAIQGGGIVFAGDLDLIAGAGIDWNSGAVVLRHSAGADAIFVSGGGFGLQTAATVGNGNPLRYSGDTSVSGVIGLPANGVIGRANKSGDGSFGSSKIFEVNRVTYDLTATSGIFYNPANVPILDDSERYFYVNNFALVSDDQLVLNDTFNSCTPTVVAQAVTAITVSPDLMGYSVSQVVGWTAYQSGAVYAQGTVTATGSGVIDTTQFASATGLPTAAVFTSTPLILVQKPNVINNNAVLDVGPQLALVRNTSTVYPAAGSYLGEIVWTGITGSGSTVGGLSHYGAIFLEVVDPTPGTSSATFHFASGSANTAKAKLTPTAFTAGSNDLIALGTSAVGWSDLHLAATGVINWNNGDCAISHGTNTLAFTGALPSAGGYQFDALVRPVTDDGAPIGSTSFKWSDLFLASGAVINFDSSDVAISHGTNTLAFTGGLNGYQFDFPIIPVSDDGAAIGTTSSKWSDLFLASGAVINFNSGDATIAHSADALTFADAHFHFSRDTGHTVGIVNTADSATASIAHFDGDRATPTNNDIAYVDFQLSNSVGTQTPFVRLEWQALDVVSTSEDGRLLFSTVVGGALTRQIQISAAQLAPVSNDGAALGATGVQWSDLFLAEGGVINWDSGDVTVTQAGNSLTIAGGNLIAEGTATTDSAAAGQIGELVTSSVESGSAVSLTTATPANVTSISLTAGDWDVFGLVHLAGNAATTVTNAFASVSGTSATLSNTAANATQIWSNGNTIFASATYVSMPPIHRRVSISSPTTFYLVVNEIFAVSTATAFGYIHARRLR